MPRIEVRWTFPLLLLALGLIGWVVARYVAAERPWGFAAVFAAVYLLLALVHELGHVAAGLALGMKWKRMVLGLGVGVGLTTRSNGEQLVISIAGPAAHVIAAVVLIAATGFTPKADPVLLAAWFGMIEAVLNLLIPHPRMDGGRAAAAAIACLKGSTAETFAGGPPPEDTEQEVLP